MKAFFNIICFIALSIILSSCSENTEEVVIQSDEEKQMLVDELIIALDNTIEFESIELRISNSGDSEGEGHFYLVSKNPNMGYYYSVGGFYLANLYIEADGIIGTITDVPKENGGTGAAFFTETKTTIFNEDGEFDTDFLGFENIKSMVNDASNIQYIIKEDNCYTVEFLEDFLVELQQETLADLEEMLLNADEELKHNFERNILQVESQEEQKLRFTIHIEDGIINEITEESSKLEAGRTQNGITSTKRINKTNKKTEILRFNDNENTINDIKSAYIG